MQRSWTTLAWAVCFPIVDHAIFSREFFFYFINLKIVHSYKCGYLKI